MKRLEKIQVMGFKAHIEDVGNTLSWIDEISIDCTIQLMNARAVAGKKHALHATLHALNAFGEGYNIAHNLGMEICLRTSAQRQISKAINILGLKEGPMEICAVGVDCDDSIIKEMSKFFKRDDKVLIPRENTLKEIYGLSDLEIKSSGGLTSLLLEKTTLLIIDK